MECHVPGFSRTSHSAAHRTAPSDGGAKDKVRLFPSTHQPDLGNGERSCRLAATSTKAKLPSFYDADVTLTGSGCIRRRRRRRPGYAALQSLSFLETAGRGFSFRKSRVNFTSPDRRVAPRRFAWILGFIRSRACESTRKFENFLPTSRVL